MISLLKVGVPIVSVALSILAVVTAFLAVTRGPHPDAALHGKLSRPRHGPIVEDFEEPTTFASGAAVEEEDEG